MAAGLAKVDDLRGQTLQWAIDTFNGSSGFVYSDSVTVLQLASESCCMGDYAVAAGALQVSLWAWCVGGAPAPLRGASSLVFTPPSPMWSS